MQKQVSAERFLREMSPLDVEAKQKDMAQKMAQNDA